MPKRTDNPDQLGLSFFTPSLVIPQGDGSVLVKPGRPVGWLSSEQMGREFGVSRKTICAWYHDGTIPEFVAGVRMVRLQGKKNYSFNAALVPHLHAVFDRALSEA